MEGEELFGYIEEEQIGVVGRKLLLANRVLQKEKHKEYLDLLLKLDLIVAIRKKVYALRKRVKKEQISGLGEETTKKRQIRPEKIDGNVVDRITAYIRERKKENIKIESREWKNIAQIANKPSAALMEAWYSPKNPFYISTPFTEEEDREIEEASGEWSVLYQKIRRAPLSLFMRYKELEHKEIALAKWTEEEEKTLREAVQKEGTGNWVAVSMHFSDKTPRQCMNKYRRSSPEIKRGKWTEEEDANLIKAVEMHKKGNWKKIKEYVPGRTGVQCRERFLYTLDPDLNSTPWTEIEDNKLIDLIQNKHITNWTHISKEFTNRNSKQCRSRYHNIKKRR